MKKLTKNRLIAGMVLSAAFVAAIGVANHAIYTADAADEYGNDFIVSEFSSPRGDFVAVVNNSQAADGSDRAFGVYGDKKFSLWLAPGQLWIVEK